MSANGASIGLKLNGAGATDAWRRALDDLPFDCAFEAIGPEAGFVADALALDADAFVVKPVGREAPQHDRRRPAADRVDGLASDEQPETGITK